MRAHDRHADRQAQAHIAFPVTRRCFVVLHGAVKQRRQFFEGNAFAVVLHGKTGVFPLLMHGKQNICRRLSVDHRVFQKVGQHLLDQDGVHGDKQEIVRRGNADRNIGKPLAEFLHDLAEDFLHDLRLFGDLGARVPDAGDGEQVLHHADQPLRLVASILQKLALLGNRQVGRFQKGGGDADDRCQRRADIVRNRAQQIGAHFLFFAFRSNPLLLLELGGHRTGDERNAQHGQERQRIAGQRKVERPIWISKNIVDADDAEQCGQNAENIAGRQT